MSFVERRYLGITDRKIQRHYQRNYSIYLLRRFAFIGLDIAAGSVCTIILFAIQRRPGCRRAQFFSLEYNSINSFVGALMLANPCPNFTSNGLCSFRLLFHQR